jgi:Zn-dependent peptidase ImmA (M78 family)
MSKINHDENGVPILSTSDIELKAEEVISYFNKQILDNPQTTPLLDYIEVLHKKFDIIRDYDHSLGSTKNGNVILGKTQLKPLGIHVDVSLTNDPRFNFVLGHEFGHLVLHRTVDLKKTRYEEQEIIDTEIDFVTGKKNLRTSRDFLEWQANYFSSAILMPRISIMKAVIQKQKENEIKRNFGRIILEAKKDSVAEYKKIQGHLTHIYSVNATNIEYRLKNLGILIDRMNLDVQHISELFTTE